MAREVVGTKFDNLCRTIEDALSELPMTEAMAICRAMGEYEEAVPRTFLGLSKVPGFRKLWIALREGCNEAVERENEGV